MKYTKDEIAEIDRVAKETSQAIMEHFPKDADFEIEMTIETTNSENGNLLLRVDANTFEISIGENSFNFMKKASLSDSTMSTKQQEITDLKYKFLKSVLVIGLPSLNARLEKQVKDRQAMHDYIMKIGVSVGCRTAGRGKDSKPGCGSFPSAGRLLYQPDQGAACKTGIQLRDQSDYERQYRDPRRKLRPYDPY